MKTIIRLEKIKVYMPFILALFAFLFQIGLQIIMRPHAFDEIYFQEWSSETMMQTVSIIDLYHSPFETLFNIHIQPPAFDIIRAIFLHLFSAEDLISSLYQVDILIYLLWSILFGVLVAIFYLWVSELIGKKIAVVATLIFLFHPANIFYTTFLDSTFLTSFLIFLLYYQLWKIKNNKEVSILSISLVFCALFFTRSIFQFPFIIIFSISLFLIGISKSKLLHIFFLTGLITIFYTGKQYYQFGLFSTSSFTGLSLNKSVGENHMVYYWNFLKNNDIILKEYKKFPRTLTRVEKLNGATNFNHIEFLKVDENLRIKYKKIISTTSALQIAKSYYENLRIYFKPSSRYTGHVIVDRIPWRNIYDNFFSFPILILMFLLSGIFAMIKMFLKKCYRANIGLIIPGFYIFLVTVFFEKGENMRYKYFLEPLIFIFLVYQICDFFKKIYIQAKTI